MLQAFVGAGVPAAAVGVPLSAWIGGAFLSVRIAFTEERGFLFMRAFLSGTCLRARKHARGFIQHPWARRGIAATPGTSRAAMT